MRRTLYVDIDSTIWPAEKEYDKAELELYGTKHLTSHWYDNDELQSLFGPDYNRIFWQALAPERVMERELYLGVESVLHELCSRGFTLHFISHNPFAKDIKPALLEWLNTVLYDEVGEDNLTVYHSRFNKVNTMKKDSTGWGIIDDVPSTIIRAVEEGYPAFAKRHPWNTVLDGMHGVNLFEEWYEIPLLVDVAMQDELGVV